MEMLQRFHSCSVAIAEDEDDDDSAINKILTLAHFVTYVIIHRIQLAVTRKPGLLDCADKSTNYTSKVKN